MSKQTKQKQQIKPAKKFRFIDHEHEYKSYGPNSLTFFATSITLAALFGPISMWWLLVSFPIHYLAFGTELHRFKK